MAPPRPPAGEGDGRSDSASRTAALMTRSITLHAVHFLLTLNLSYLLNLLSRQIVNKCLHKSTASDLSRERKLYNPAATFSTFAILSPHWGFTGLCKSWPPFHHPGIHTCALWAVPPRTPSP